MKFKLIYPKWAKLDRQTEFHLPPHGPVVFAAALPNYVAVDFVDENLEPIDFDDDVDFVGISMMLTVQVKRGWEIADIYRKKGVKVIFGGIATMLHAEETMPHADAIFLGEAEGRMEQVLTDFRQNTLKPRYDFIDDRPDIALVGPALKDKASVAAAVTAALVGLLTVGFPLKTGLLAAAFVGILTGLLVEGRPK